MVYKMQILLKIFFYQKSKIWFLKLKTKARILQKLVLKIDILAIKKSSTVK